MDTQAKVGIVDNYGYLYCVPCAFMRGIEGTPVYSMATHSDEPCDGCQKIVQDRS